MSLLRALAKKRKVVWLFSLVWGLTLLFGFRELLNYSSQPGESRDTGNKWPITSSIRQSSHGSTLLVFAHPLCPCTRATATELDRLMRAVRKFDLTTYVLLFRPKEKGEDWTKTSLRKKFEKIPGVKVLSDPGGVEAEKFGAMTSGQAVLFNKEGQMLFRGGITASRGHEGDNQSEDALIKLVEGTSHEKTKGSVFGCSLRKPASLGWAKQ